MSTHFVHTSLPCTHWRSQLLLLRHAVDSLFLPPQELKRFLLRKFSVLYVPVRSNFNENLDCGVYARRNIWRLSKTAVVRCPPDWDLVCSPFSFLPLSLATLGWILSNKLLFDFSRIHLAFFDTVHQTLHLVWRVQAGFVEFTTTHPTKFQMFLILQISQTWTANYPWESYNLHIGCNVDIKIKIELACLNEQLMYT